MPILARGRPFFAPTQRSRNGWKNCPPWSRCRSWWSTTAPIATNNIGMLISNWLENRKASQTANLEPNRKAKENAKRIANRIPKRIASRIPKRIANRIPKRIANRIVNFLFLFKYRLCHNMSVIDLSSTEPKFQSFFELKREMRNCKNGSPAAVMLRSILHTVYFRSQ